MQVKDELNKELIEAAKNGDIKAFQLLKDQGADLHYRDKQFGLSVLLAAVAHCRIPMVEYLLNNNLAAMSERSNNGDSPLLLAAANGQISMVEYFLKKKLSKISEKNTNGYSSLLLAARYGYIPMVEYLLKKGAFVDVLTNLGETPYQFVQQHPQAKKEALPLLLAAETLLKLAPNADSNSVELSDALKTLNDAINGKQVSDGNSALHLAILHKNKVLIRLLFERGADCHLANNHNRTPMQLGLSSEVPYILQFFNLIKLEALVKVPDVTVLDEDKGDFKETKKSKESLEQSIISPEALEKLIEAAFKGIQELSEQQERNELLYKFGTILSKADSLGFRPVLAYKIFNLITPYPIKQYEEAHYKAYELVIGGHVIISKSKNQLEETPEVLPNMGSIPNDALHYHLRLKTGLNHLHLANYQDKDGRLFSRLAAEFALGPAESMKGIPGLTGINGESQFALLNLLHSTHSRLEQERRLKEEALEKEQGLIREKEALIGESIKEKQKTDIEKARLAAEIDLLKSQLRSLSGSSAAPSDSKEREDNPHSPQIRAKSSFVP